MTQGPYRPERSRASEDLDATYWFAQKSFGYGATPVTWQGWVFTLGFILSVVALTQSPIHEHTKMALIALATGAFFIIARVKTKGGFAWRWGKRD